MASEIKSTSRFTSDKDDRTRKPRMQKTRDKFLHPIVMMTGGAGTPATNAFTDVRHLVLALESAGYSVFMCDVSDCGLGGGPGSAETRIQDTVNHAASLGYTKTPVILGQSNGSSAGLRYIAEGNAVSAFVLVLPPLAMQYLYDTDAHSLRASIETAWGVTYPAPLPEPADPLVTAADGGYGSTPMLIVYASDDDFTLGTGDDLTDFLASQTSATAISVGALGHTSTACEAAPATTVVQFIKSNTN